MERRPSRQTERCMAFLGLGLDIGVIGPAILGLAAIAAALRRVAGRHDRD